MRRPAAVIIPLSFAFASTSAALPPGETRFRDGANHRIGDDSFAARFGRAPEPGTDDEKLRMRTHLEHIRARLAAAPATRPELAARRAELLGYLGEYIAKGITPRNTQVPWRTPVFIDDFGNVCAVGYLIERSVGRALPAKIARLHRFDFLEDIAAAMPEVRAWIEGSGLTLDELASIQPGYLAPQVEQWSRWHLGGKVRPPDGEYKLVGEEVQTVTTGRFLRGQMTGAWKRVTTKGRLVGSGTFDRGAGTWTSFYPDGKRFATGSFSSSLPSGPWVMYHRSGNVAAEGRFEGGERHGAWKFFHDTPAKTPIASGSFRGGSITGRWEHFDQHGKRVAVSSDATPTQWRGSGGHLLVVEPNPAGLRHSVHHGNIAGDDWRLDGFALGGEQVYVQMNYDGSRMFDANGRELEQAGGAWIESDCKWSAKRKAVAQAGDITTLHGLLSSDTREGKDCVAPKAVSPARAKKLDALAAQMHVARAPNPAFVKEAMDRAQVNPYIEAEPDEPAGAEAGAEKAAPKSDEDKLVEQRYADVEADFTKMLASHMGWYIEFPHIDGRFIQLFYTLPGFTEGLDTSEFAEATD